MRNKGNNMRIIFTILVFLFSYQAVGKDKIKYDEILAVELSRAYLQAYFRGSPDREVKNIDWKNSIQSSARDGNGRAFAFVGFKVPGKKDGASMRLEICAGSDLYPSWYGGSSNVDEDLEQFKSISGDKTADYPGQCPAFE